LGDVGEIPHRLFSVIVNVPFVHHDRKPGALQAAATPAFPANLNEHPCSAVFGLIGTRIA